MRLGYLIALLIPAGLAGSTVYTVRDLGMPGATAYRINGSGAAAGWSVDANGNRSAFVHGGKEAVPLTGQGGQANGINSDGAVAGTIVSGGQSIAGVWEGTSFSALGDLGGNSWATDVNDRGHVAGSANGSAAIFADGSVTDLGGLRGSASSSASAINSEGNVVGWSQWNNGAVRAFTWSADEGMQAVGTLGGQSSYATGLNDSGQIAGHSSLGSGDLHAFVYSDGQMSDLGTLGGGSSYAYDINSSGDVVGYSWLAGDRRTSAYLYRNGRMLDLNDAIEPASGWLLLEAYGINDLGQIVGSGMWNGERRAFRLDAAEVLPALSLSRVEATQTPEPGSMVLAGAGVIAFALVRFRRRKS